MPLEPKDVDDRDEHERAGDDRERLLACKLADRTGSVDFVAVHGRGKAQLRARQRTIDCEDRGRDRDTLEQFGRRPGQAPGRTWWNLGAEEPEWFRGPLRAKYRDEVLSDAMTDSGLFNADYLRLLQQQHDSGRRDNSVAMWALLMFALSNRHLATN